VLEMFREVRWNLNRDRGEVTPPKYFQISSSSSSIGTATLVRFGLINYR